ncbi:hypothetical protein IN09_004283 [Salmonella enterica subsp. enterica]|nr:hypothetical protein [Salmonella enterica subsp. enterica]
MPVSVVGVNISKTGNYTILITVSITKFCQHINPVLHALIFGHPHPRPRLSCSKFC